MRVLYISARLFQVQYTNAVLQNEVNDFINFYQTIDMLIVDDIQEWATATKTQDTFFHIFNHLLDRKSTRLNSSHANISYAVFCLKKKKHLKSNHYNITYSI